MAARLWDGLGRTGPVHHLACVSLLHHLHNVAFAPKAIERIVVRSLSYGNELLPCQQRTVVDAFHKFTLFWHLSRDLASKKSVFAASGRSVLSRSVHL